MNAGAVREARSPLKEATDWRILADYHSSKKTIDEEKQTHFDEGRPGTFAVSGDTTALSFWHVIY
jgi:hypothetical protein